ncbi:MAG TPA: multiheme c-type cytochrome [Gammaproteobacteria bacterium]|nr:multiheme c-type cytochrome [Gammaproteobacteria bacterium]
MSTHRDSLIRRRRNGASALLLMLATLVAAAQDADEPESKDAPAKALGVVTCAGSTCHGAAKPLSESKVMQNEFIIWHREDRHARAYRSLLGEQGRKIAQNLGLASAADAPECLACHTNYVPAAQRGKRYELADGVACEACHGAASKWLGMHVTGEASRADNLKAGMYPTEEPVARAQLCLSCHLGSASKFATHRIMGAGHPRLSFELDTFTQIQPAHYRADADYRSRKQVYGGMQVWAVGQVLAAQRTLALFTSPKWQGNAVFPEFAFFDCHGCHHPMSEQRWAPRASTGLPPGAVQFNDANMLMLLYLMKHVDPTLAERLHDGMLALHRATTESMAATQKAAAELSGVLYRVRGAVVGHGFGRDDINAVLKSLVAGGLGGDYQDYSAAEQAAMAMAALVDALRASGDLEAARGERLAAGVKALYGVLENENAWQPARFVAELQHLETALN